MSIPMHSPPDGPLPEKQQRLFDFILSKGRIPDVEEMRQHMGWKQVGSVYDCLSRLAWRGKIIRLTHNTYTLAQHE